MEWRLIESPPWNLVNYLDRTVKYAFSLTVSCLLLFLLTLSTIHGRYIPINEWVGTSPMRCQYIILGVVIGKICSDGIICIIAESKALRVGNPGKVSFDASLQYFYVNYCVSCCCCYCFKKVWSQIWKLGTSLRKETPNKQQRGLFCEPSGHIRVLDGLQVMHEILGNRKQCGWKESTDTGMEMAAKWNLRMPKHVNNSMTSLLTILGAFLFLLKVL